MKDTLRINTRVEMLKNFKEESKRQYFMKVKKNRQFGNVSSL